MFDYFDDTEKVLELLHVTLPSQGIETNQRKFVIQISDDAAIILRLTFKKRQAYRDVIIKYLFCSKYSPKLRTESFVSFIKHAKTKLTGISFLISEKLYV